MDYSNEWEQQNNKYKSNENVIAGIVGALLGSLIGVAAIMLLSYLGYMASISGAIMAIFTIKGYELFAKRSSKKGFVISTLISIVMIFIAFVLGIGLTIYLELGKDIGATFADSVSSISTFMEDSEFAAAFYTDLAMLYLFALLGFIPTIRNKIAEKKMVQK